ncbi:MAG: hypothetical protein JJ895_04415 [Balneolaceae bacterium]|nr:hypothetical protein [Balneolaceae bacterium]
MEFLPEWAPNIHPLVIHFPIALIILAFGMSIASLFVSEKWWDEQKNTLLYILASISAIAVFYTGKSAADSIFLVTEAQTVLTEHADWALWTVWFFGLYSVLRVILHRFDLINRKAIKVVMVFLALPGLFFLYETGEYGGKMVYGYGAGTGQLLSNELEESLSTDSLVTSSSSSFIYDTNDKWKWTISKNGVSELLQNFHWVSGSVSDLSPITLQSNQNHLLQLSLKDAINSFVTHSSYQNIQLDAYLNMDDLSGSVKLMHHFVDMDNYDYVSIDSDRTVIQGRVINGNDTIFESSSTYQTGVLFIRVVGDGTHFRGYINQEMVVHGHGDAPNPGAVGLLIEGNGTILIDKIELTQL